MKSVITAVFAIHIVFSRPTEDREAKVIRYETSNGIKLVQNGTFRNIEIENALNLKGKGISGARSDGSGKNEEDLESLNSYGNLKGNSSADENMGFIVMQSRINQNCSKTALGFRVKEDVTLQPLISNGSLEGNTGGMLATNQNSTNEMKSTSELRIEKKVAPQSSISYSRLENNQTEDQHKGDGAIINRVSSNVQLQPQISNRSNSSLEENKTMDEEYDYEEIEIRINVNAMKSILGGRKK